MAAAPDSSERVVEQRLRSRAIEALETLADGDDGVRLMGVGEYVEEFFGQHRRSIALALEDLERVQRGRGARPRHRSRSLGAGL